MNHKRKNEPNDVLDLSELTPPHAKEKAVGPEPGDPPPHDRLFKWLIKSYIHSFFELFAPKVTIKNTTFLDKEFERKLKGANLESDLFIAMETDINGKAYEITILIEHESSKTDIRQKMRRYMCYASLVRIDLPVMMMALYTDDADWKSYPPNSFVQAMDENCDEVPISFRLIKLTDYEASDLIAKPSMLAKLLSLKAAHRKKSIAREDLLRDIYAFAVQIEPELSDDHRLLIEQFVAQYSKIEQNTVERIKREVNMNVSAPTITKHYELIGEERGIKLGEKRGEERGIKLGEERGVKLGAIEGQIKAFKSLLDEGLLTQAQYDEKVTPLKEKLDALN